jgi:hypothetical protein
MTAESLKEYSHYTAFQQRVARARRVFVAGEDVVFL